MLKLVSLKKEQLQIRLDAAQGRIPCDLVIRNVRYLDVYHCEWRTGDIAIADGTIVGIEPGLRGMREIDGRGKWLVPGFIDAHVHVESSMMVPDQFQRAVLSKGTTSAVCDPHELANVVGVDGIEYFLEAAEQLALDLFVMLSSCVPATHLETNGGGTIGGSELANLLFKPRAIGLAEVMNVPGVLNKDPEVLNKLSAFSFGPMDGHCPLLSGQALSAYVSTGISSCHETSRLEEAREKLTKGMSVWIREGSVAKDLRTLAPALTLATSTSIGFCTDDRNPLDIGHEGHIDHLVRGAIALGVPETVAYRSASWSVARHYGLLRRGGISPGHIADLILLDDARNCAISTVFKGGVDVRELAFRKVTVAQITNTVKAAAPEEADLRAPEGRVHVIRVEAGKIITGRAIMNHGDPGVLRLSVLERYGHGSKPANAWVTGFGDRMHGAIASSVGHDNHNLIVVGDTTADMRQALSAVISMGGGFAVVRDGAVIASVALPFGGLMCELAPHVLARELETLRAASQRIGCELPEPFLQLAFLSLPVIPELKLTDKGLVDVNEFRVIDVRV